MQVRIDAIRQSLDDLFGNLRPPLPDRPQAEVGEADESGWLYDSARDYMSQLASYNAARGEGAKRQKDKARMEEYHLTCDYCGTPFKATKRRKPGGVAYCGKKCGQKASYHRMRAGRGSP